MTSGWFWWAGRRSDEGYEIGPAQTRELAIEEALGQGVYMEIDPDPEDGHPEWRARIHLVEARQHSIEDVKIDGSQIIEMLEEGPLDDWASPDGDPLFFNEAGPKADLTVAQLLELTRRLSEAFHAWVRDTPGVKFHPLVFADTRNEETVTFPHPDAEAEEKDNG